MSLDEPPSPLGFSLHEAAAVDTQRVHELLSLPEVCEFLSDGRPPTLAEVNAWMSSALDGPPPLGLWLLRSPEGDVSGCVRISTVADGAATGELTYVLHPKWWGRGLATAMGRAVLSRVFETHGQASILAGADQPNARSIEVMKRLGMRWLRDVEYPMGPGVEYWIDRSAFEAMPHGSSVPFDNADNE